jgi:hypothetical protein
MRMRAISAATRIVAPKALSTSPKSDFKMRIATPPLAAKVTSAVRMPATRIAMIVSLPISGKSAEAVRMIDNITRTTITGPVKKFGNYPVDPRAEHRLVEFAEKSYQADIVQIGPVPTYDRHDIVEKLRANL